MAFVKLATSNSGGLLSKLKKAVTGVPTHLGNGLFNTNTLSAKSAATGAGGGSGFAKTSQLRNQKNSTKGR